MKDNKKKSCRKKPPTMSGPQKCDKCEKRKKICKKAKGGRKKKNNKRICTYKCLKDKRKEICMNYFWGKRVRGLKGMAISNEIARSSSFPDRIGE